MLMDPEEKKIELDLYERIQILPQPILDIFSLGYVDDVVDDLKVTHELSEKQAIILHNAITLVLMLLIRKGDLIQNLMESLPVSESLAIKLYTRIEEEVFQISPEIEALLAYANEEFELPPEIEDVPTTIPSTEQLEPTFKTESVTPTSETIVPLRTMSADIEKIHGYGAFHAEQQAEQTDTDEAFEPIVQAASQDEVLTGKKAVADLPNYNDQAGDNSPNA